MLPSYRTLKDMLNLWAAMTKAMLPRTSHPLVEGACGEGSAIGVTVSQTTEPRSSQHITPLPPQRAGFETKPPRMRCCAR